MGLKTVFSNIFQKKPTDQKESVTSESPLMKCLKSNKRDDFEDRFYDDYAQVPEFASLINDVNENRVAKAAASYNEARSKYPDHFFSYWAYAGILDRFGQYSQAQEVIAEGLEKSKSKYLLYSKRGVILFHDNKLNDAICCWLKSILYQTTIQMDLKKLRDDDPFLYLGYIAQILDMERETHILQTNHKCIRGDVQLVSTEVEKIKEILRTANKSAIKPALEEICNRLPKIGDVSVTYRKMQIIGEDPIKKNVNTMLNSTRVSEVENAISELRCALWEPNNAEEIVEFYLGSNDSRIVLLDSMAIPPLLNIIRKFSFQTSEYSRKQIAINHLKVVVERCSAPIRDPENYGTEENMREAESAQYELKMASQTLHPTIKNIAKDLLKCFERQE